LAEYPDLNYCPQCGASLEDRQAYGRLRRYCPACERVIFRDPKAAAGVLVVQDGQVLLVRRGMGLGQGRWSIPAGFIEYDEDPAVTACRECLEETGLEVTLTGLVDVIPGEGLPGEASFLIVYQGRVTGGQLCAADDAAQAAFFPLNDLPPLAFAATRRALAAYRDQATGGSG
jgi:8-oxo-dGTP diphosphatase